MSHYCTVVDMSVPNSSHVILARMIPTGAKVLDVGCASGYFGAVLKDRGSHVTGIELNPADAAEARAVLDRVLEADVEAEALTEIVDGERFDAVVFGDVLEHLVDPAAALRGATEVLTEGGAVYVSIPNVAHGALRLGLLQGRWQTVDAGLLDRTHLRFYTFDTLGDLLREGGLRVTDMRATVLDPLGTEVEIVDEALPRDVVDWVRHQPHATVYQFVFRAVPGPPGPLPDPIPDIELPVADDEHTARARAIEEEAARLVALTTEVEEQCGLVEEQRGLVEEQRALAEEQRALAEERHQLAEERAATVVELRHQLLRARDHSIGAEAELGVARHERDVARGQAAHAIMERDAAVADAGHTRRNFQVARIVGPFYFLLRPLWRLARAVRRG